MCESVLGSSVSKRFTRKPHGIYKEFLEDFLSFYEHQIFLWFAGKFLCQFLFLKLTFSYKRKSVTLDLVISACKASARNCSWEGPCVGGGRQGRGAKACWDVSAARGMEGTKGKW